MIVGGILDAKADLFAFKALAHEITVGVIHVVNHRAGVVFCKQAALGALVVLKIGVLAGSDVILRQVREGHDLKRHAVHAVVRSAWLLTSSTQWRTPASSILRNSRCSSRLSGVVLAVASCTPAMSTPLEPM